MIISTCSELTIDGRLTLEAGQSSKTLFNYYGPELQQWFHQERAAHDVIMVGAATVRADNPELTVRHAPGRSPLRVIATNDGSIPIKSHILTDRQPTLFAIPSSLPAKRRAMLRLHPAIELLECGEDRVDVAVVVAKLKARGHVRMMVEGGSRLLHSFFAAGLVHRIIIKHIPVISGSTSAPTFLSSPGGSKPFNLSQWKVKDWRLVGGVGVSIYEPVEPILWN